jgi:hypothetical protein
MNASAGGARDSLIICQVWGFLLFLPAIAEVTAERSRYLLFWTTGDLVLHVGAVAALGLALFGLGCLLRLLLRPAAVNTLITVAAIVTLFFVAQGLIYTWAAAAYAYAVAPLGVGTAFLLLILSAHPRLNFAWAQGKLARGAMLLGAVPVVFWGMCLTYGTYPPHEYPPAHAVADRPDAGADGPADNVYVFIFDSWSYRLTFDRAGAVRPEFPAVRALAEEACVFTEGYSPGCQTLESLPRLLFQRRDLFVLHGGQTGFWNAGQFVPCREAPSLFTEARARNYRTYMVGWHNPYHTLLEDRCDYVHSVSSQQLVGPTPLERFAGIYWRFAGQLSGPVLNGPCRCSDYLQLNYAFAWQNENLQRHARAVLADPRPAGQFAVLHLPPPHTPFVCRPDGIRELNAPYDYTNETLARDQLAYADGVIGSFLDQLRAGGKYDNSIVVLTSDHSWREDPTLERTARELTHVPVLIRFPGQKQRVTVTAPFSTSALAGLLDYVRSSPEGWRNLDQVVATRQWHFPVADEEVEIKYIPVR